MNLKPRTAQTFRRRRPRARSRLPAAFAQTTDNKPAESKPAERHPPHRVHRPPSSSSKPTTSPASLSRTTPTRSSLPCATCWSLGPGSTSSLSERDRTLRSARPAGARAEDHCRPRSPAEDLPSHLHPCRLRRRQARRHSALLHGRRRRTAHRPQAGRQDSRRHRHLRKAERSGCKPSFSTSTSA